MHEQFADWYRQATLERDAAFLNKRWKLVEATVQGLTPLGAMELVRLHFGLPGYDRASLGGLFDALKERGPSYARPELTLELRILAGAGLVRLLDMGQAGPRNGHLSILGGLAVLGLRRLPDGMPAGPDRELLCRLASQLLTQLSGVYRQHRVPKAPVFSGLPALPAFRISTTQYRLVKTTLKKNRDYYNSESEHTEPIEIEIPSIIDLTEWNTKVNDTLASYWSALATAFQSELERYAKIIPQFHTALHEENNILWWLFGEASNELRCPLADLPISARCLVAGRELADLTQVIPGPRATLAFLDRALRVGLVPVPKEVAMADAVAALNPDWRESAVAKIPAQVLELCPIHQALREGAGRAHATAATFPPTWAPLELAHQMYGEQLLARLFRWIEAESKS